MRKIIEKQTKYSNKKNDAVTKENTNENKSNQFQISNDPYKKLITGGLRSVKLNALPNLINHQPDIDKIY